MTWGRDEHPTASSRKTDVTAIFHDPTDGLPTLRSR